MSGIRSIRRGSTLVGVATDASAPIYVDKDDNILKMVPAGSGSSEVQVVDASSVQTLTNKTLTSPTQTSPTLSSPTITGTITNSAVMSGPAPVAQAAGTTLALTAALHAGKTVYFTDTDGFTFTLPAATGTGNKYRIEFGATAAGNQIVDVVGNDSMAGVAHIHDEDTAAVSGFRASGDADRMTMNGTTTGGQIGDTVEFEDVATDKWAVRAVLSCPAGSNPATPFATGQIS